MSSVVLVAAALLGLATGAAWSAFSGTTTNGGNTFSAAASFAPVFVQQLGTSSCGGATSSVVAPSGGATAGNTVVVTLTLRGATTGAVSVTDSRGNVYAVDADRANANIRTLVFSSRLDAALAAGETITASHPFSDDAQAMSAAEFAGVPPGLRIDDVATASGMGATIDASVNTTNPDDILVSAAGNPNDRSYSEAAGWTTLADLSTNCGGGRGRLTHHAAYRIVSSPGTWPYSAAISAPDRWAAGLVAYKG